MNRARQGSRLLTLVRTREPDDADRSRVLDGALDAFLDFGIRRTSMGEIARRARLSPATLYRRFGQKRDVVTAVTLREVRRFLAEVDATVDRTASAEDQLADLAVLVFTTLRTHPLLRRLVATESDLVLPQLTVGAGPILELGRDYLTEFITRLQGEGKAPDFDPGPLAEALVRLAQSIVLTPETSLPTDDEELRRLARVHAAWLLQAPPTGAEQGWPDAG